jgi:hypothetical protein
VEDILQAVGTGPVEDIAPGADTALEADTALGPDIALGVDTARGDTVQGDTVLVLDSPLGASDQEDSSQPGGAGPGGTGGPLQGSVRHHVDHCADHHVPRVSWPSSEPSSGACRPSMPHLRIRLNSSLNLNSSRCASCDAPRRVSCDRGRGHRVLDTLWIRYANQSK